jgi:hypothetical protein
MAEAAIGAATVFDQIKRHGHAHVTFGDYRPGTALHGESHLIVTVPICFHHGYIDVTGLDTRGIRRTAGKRHFVVAEAFGFR